MITKYSIRYVKNILPTINKTILPFIIIGKVLETNEVIFRKQKYFKFSFVDDIDYLSIIIQR